MTLTTAECETIQWGERIEGCTCAPYRDRGEWRHMVACSLVTPPREYGLAETWAERSDRRAAHLRELGDFDPDYGQWGYPSAGGEREMNTRKYSDRKVLKRISRSPIYQALRDRALAAERTAFDQKKMIDELCHETAALRRECDALLQ